MVEGSKCKILDYTEIHHLSCFTTTMVDDRAKALIKKMSSFPGKYHGSDYRHQTDHLHVNGSD